MQTSTVTSTLPATALLRKYTDAGGYTDCYFTEVPGSISLAEYVESFYTSWVFKLERWILTHAVEKPSSDSDARRVAWGETGCFAAWSVEGRASDQLLMCDYLHRTRSWFMIAPVDGGTRLYFGSAVVPVRGKSGEPMLGSTYSALMGFHKLYSRILLNAARSRVSRQAD